MRNNITMVEDATMLDIINHDNIATGIVMEIMVKLFKLMLKLLFLQLVGLVDYLLTHLILDISPVTVLQLP